MRPDGVVLPVPAVGRALGLSHRGEQLGVRNSSLNRLLNDSAKPFCHGEPGSIYAIVTLLFWHQLLRAWAMNSGPLSLRMNAGAG